jgi:hypothetical protein
VRVERGRVGLAFDVDVESAGLDLRREIAERPARTPSTTRWSTERPSVVSEPTSIFPSRTIGRCEICETDRIELCGGVMIA